MHAEEKLFSNLFTNHFGKHILVVGVAQQIELLKSINIPCHALLSPLVSKDTIPGYIEADLDELPILTEV